MANKETNFDTIVIGAGIGGSRQTQIDGGQRPGTSTGDARRIAELEREVRELRRANEILKVYFARELELDLKRPLSFAGLLRQLRDEAGLTQEELAEAASLSPRSVSDLERGVNLTARHDTARLLAGALGLTGPQRALFEAAARGRAPAGQALAARDGAAAATRTLPRDIASFTGRAAEVAQLAGAVKGAAAAIHRCLGAHLATMELRMALEEWLARYPDFELADPAAVTGCR